MQPCMGLIRGPPKPQYRGCCTGIDHKHNAIVSTADVGAHTVGCRWDTEKRSAYRIGAGGRYELQASAAGDIQTAHA